MRSPAYLGRHFSPEPAFQVRLRGRDGRTSRSNANRRSADSAGASNPDEVFQCAARSNTGAPAYSGRMGSLHGSDGLCTEEPRRIEVRCHGFRRLTFARPWSPVADDGDRRARSDCVENANEPNLFHRLQLRTARQTLWQGARDISYRSKNFGNASRCPTSHM